MKRVCVLTSSRADYDLLRPLLYQLDTSQFFSLDLIVSGMHLKHQYGLTESAIQRDGFRVAAHIDMLGSSASGKDLGLAIGRGVSMFAHAFETLKPELLVLLGDRFELLAAGTAALMMRIPMAHIHGGESTQGAFDEAVRHSLTKMSHLHFVAADQYRLRVLQLGEEPWRVHMVGGLGVDALQQTQLLTQGEVESRLKCDLSRKSLLVTFHPVTLDSEPSEQQLATLLEALDEFSETTLIFTLPNADTGGEVLAQQIRGFCDTRPDATLHESLGNPLYLSCLNAVSAVVGNSSSGLLEAPSLATPTVNIGKRQDGRLRAPSVLDCAADKVSIVQAIKAVTSDQFRHQVDFGFNPYGSGGASNHILRILEAVDLNELLIKKFVDWPPPPAAVQDSGVSD